MSIRFVSNWEKPFRFFCLIDASYFYAYPYYRFYFKLLNFGIDLTVKKKTKKINELPF